MCEALSDRLDLIIILVRLGLNFLLIIPAARQYRRGGDIVTRSSVRPYVCSAAAAVEDPCCSSTLVISSPTSLLPLLNSHMKIENSSRGLIIFFTTITFTVHYSALFPCWLKTHLFHYSYS